VLGDTAHLSGSAGGFTKAIDVSDKVLEGGLKEKRLLDVGCGLGNFLNEVKERGGHSSGIDTEPRRVCGRPFSLREWTYDRQEAETKLLAGSA
jgi:hypothetical protein